MKVIRGDVKRRHLIVLLSVLHQSDVKDTVGDHINVFTEV